MCLRYLRPQLDGTSFHTGLLYLQCRLQALRPTPWIREQVYVPTPRRRFSSPLRDVNTIHGYDNISTNSLFSRHSLIPKDLRIASRPLLRFIGGCRILAPLNATQGGASDNLMPFLG